MEQGDFISINIRKQLLLFEDLLKMVIVLKYASISVRSSPVERFPDKKEVQGPTPCARTLKYI